jgi:CheY-like chemotaxis protein
VVNARDAMPTGGRLTIQTIEIPADDPRLIADAASRPHVRLSVADSGCGMPPEILSRIFEPFFTTKKTGKGTGLGLSTVYGIVTQSGGHISVESEVGKGSVFHVDLPAQPRRAATGLNAVGTAGEAPRGSETVLVVEDEAPVRKLVRRMLEGVGYRVLEAGSAVDAITLLVRDNVGVDLLVTDVIMPQMSGRDLARRLKDHLPDLKVLFISGYTDDALADHGVLAPGIALLEKPFSPESLARKVREVLAAGPP